MWLSSCVVYPAAEPLYCFSEGSSTFCSPPLSLMSHPKNWDLVAKQLAIPYREALGCRFLHKFHRIHSKWVVWVKIPLLHPINLSPTPLQRRRKRQNSKTVQHFIVHAVTALQKRQITCSNLVKFRFRPVNEHVREPDDFAVSVTHEEIFYYSRVCCLGGNKNAEENVNWRRAV